MLRKKIPSLKQLKKKILTLPKWGWGIIVFCYLLGLIPGFTILIWLPGTSVISILIGITIVEYLQKKLSN